jgi:hypothetical protein
MRFEVGERRCLRQGIEALLSVGGQRGLAGAPLDQLEGPQPHKVLRAQGGDRRLAEGHAAQRDGFVVAEPCGRALDQVAGLSLLESVSSVFGSWGLLCPREGAIPSASRIALLRRFRASSRAEPSVTILEICMACTLLSKHDS